MARFAFRIRRGDTLRVPEQTLTSVGFVCDVLGHDLAHDSLDPIGAGFIVSMPHELPTIRTFVFVTNKHVIKHNPNVPKVVSINGLGAGKVNT